MHAGKGVAVIAPRDGARVKGFPGDTRDFETKTKRLIASIRPIGPINPMNASYVTRSDDGYVSGHEFAMPSSRR